MVGAATGKTPPAELSSGARNQHVARQNRNLETGNNKRIQIQFFQHL